MTHNPALSLRGHFSAADSAWRIRSNCAAVLHSAAEAFPSLRNASRADLILEVYVDAEGTAPPLWHVPQFRGRDHLVFADFGPGDHVLADLQTRRLIGRFSPTTATNADYWKRVIFPILLGIAGATVNVTPLHCACLRYKGEGLLITGESGAGKSTLSFELTRRGLDFISDDWTYFSQRGLGVLGWGLPTSIKLLPDSVSHFPELQSQTPVMHLNGELALEIDPEQFGAKRELCCRPTRVFLLDRQPGAGFATSRLAAHEIAEYFRQTLEKLPACLEKHRAAQLSTIRALCRAESWHLRCGGSPREIASRILQLCDDLPPASQAAYFPLQVTRREWPDMLRRFVPLQLRKQFSIGGYTFQVETDSARIMRALHCIAEPATLPSSFHFSWTIQEEAGWTSSGKCSPGLAIGELSFLAVAGHSFVALDRAAARAIAFVAASNTDSEIKAMLRVMALHLIREAASVTQPVPFGSGSASKLHDTLRPADA